MKCSPCGLGGKKTFQLLGKKHSKKSEKVQLVRYEGNQVNEVSWMLRELRVLRQRNDESR